MPLAPPVSINSYESYSRQLSAPLLRISAQEANAEMSSLIAPSDEPLLERLSTALRIQTDKAPLTLEEQMDHFIV